MESLHYINVDIIVLTTCVEIKFFHTLPYLTAGIGQLNIIEYLVN